MGELKQCIKPALEGERSETATMLYMSNLLKFIKYDTQNILFILAFIS